MGYDWARNLYICVRHGGRRSSERASDFLVLHSFFVLDTLVRSKVSVGIGAGVLMFVQKNKEDEKGDGLVVVDVYICWRLLLNMNRT